MLVLSRKVGEEIVIGDNIRVKVLSVRGNQIRLGFVAPANVQIQREELIQRSREPEVKSGPVLGERVAPDVVVVAQGAAPRS